MGAIIACLVLTSRRRPEDADSPVDIDDLLAELRFLTWVSWLAVAALMGWLAYCIVEA